MKSALSERNGHKVAHLGNEVYLHLDRVGKPDWNSEHPKYEYQIYVNNSNKECYPPLVHNWISTVMSTGVTKNGHQFSDDTLLKRALKKVSESSSRQIDYLKEGMYAMDVYKEHGGTLERGDIGDQKYLSERIHLNEMEMSDATHLVMFRDVPGAFNAFVASCTVPFGEDIRDAMHKILETELLDLQEVNTLVQLQVDPESVKSTDKNIETPERKGMGSVQEHIQPMEGIIVQDPKNDRRPAMSYAAGNQKQTPYTMSLLQRTEDADRSRDKADEDYLKAIARNDPDVDKYREEADRQDRFAEEEHMMDWDREWK